MGVVGLGEGYYPLDLRAFAGKKRICQYWSLESVFLLFSAFSTSRPNGKLIHNSILNGPYVRKLIPEPGDANREITVTETFHLQTDDELSDKELKQIKADDQAIQTILLVLSEDIYAAEKKAKLFNEWERFSSNEGESIESYCHRFLKLMNDLKRNKHFPEKIASNLKFLSNLQPEWSRHVTIVHQTKDLHTSDYTQLYDFLKYNQKEVAPHQDQSSFNLTYLQQPIPNPKDVTDPTTAMNLALALMAKAFKLNYSTPTNNNQRISSNPRNRQIAQPAGYNDFIGNQVIQNAVQNPRVQNARNQNGLIGVQGNGNQNQIGNGNLVAARAEENTAGQNGNQIRDAAYLQTQLLIAQNEEAGIQLQAKEYDLMAAAADPDEIKEVLNYARENAHLKATYKNMFDSISMSCAQTKTIIASLQNELQSNIYKNAKLRTQLFKKVSDQKDNTQDTSMNTKFAKQPIVKNLPKIGETNALSKPVTSNSVSTPQESKGVNNDKVIASGMFRINPSKTFRKEKHVPNTVRASNRTKPITVSQPPVITKKDVNSNLNGLSSTGVDNTKTRRPQPRSNTKHDRVPSASKSSRSKD
uniref:Gag-Pol polyprotein n=1 Tax=Tanacetum cinerariifolium TaxID=118510 RepID=A0A6L2KAA1_TANCI|nr:hypothetical protein [Tanacetum cinerariifolium]